jgi:hypothetical protein
MSEVVPTIERGQDTHTGAAQLHSTATLQRVCLYECRLFLTLLPMYAYEKEHTYYMTIYENVFKNCFSDIAHNFSYTIDLE